MMLHGSLVFSFLLVFGVHQSQASTDLKKSPSDLSTIILSNLVNKVFRLDHEMEKQRKLNKLQQEKIKALEKQLAAEHDKHRPIGFHVVLTQTQTARPAAIAFNQVISNYGNGWSNFAHNFVAPEKGLYLFYLSFLNVHKVTSWAEIRRGATSVSRSYAQGDSYNTGTCSAVLQLQKGEHVSAWLMYGQLHGDSWAHFGGTLIQS